MNAVRRGLLLAIVAALFGSPDHVLGQTLPLDLQRCFNSGQCSDLQLLPQLPPDGPVRRWQYSDNVSGEAMFLLQYEISGESARDDDPINQLFWLTAQQRYDGSTGLDNLVTLYHDDRGNPFSTIPLPATTRMRLTSDALLMGTGQTGFLEVTDMPKPGAPPSMQLDEPFICLADGCYLQASLNLVGLRYQTSGNGEIAGSMLPLLPQDDPLLFTQIRGFPGFAPDGAEGFDESLTLIVAPLAVPEPSSLVFLAVAALVASGRRNSRHHIPRDVPKPTSSR